MVILTGTRKTTTTPVNVGQNDVMKTGTVYEAVYPVEGIGTIIPSGWEQEAINNIRAQLATAQCVPTYIETQGVGFGTQSVLVQFEYRPTGAQAEVAPIVWAVVALLLVTGIIVWLKFYGASTIRDMGEALSDNPMLAYAVYGIIAIALLLLLRRRGYDDYDDEPRDRVIVINTSGQQIGQYQ